jgi:hypothetical protein
MLTYQFQRSWGAPVGGGTLARLQRRHTLRMVAVGGRAGPERSLVIIFDRKHLASPPFHNPLPKATNRMHIAILTWPWDLTTGNNAPQAACRGRSFDRVATRLGGSGLSYPSIMRAA